MRRLSQLQLQYKQHQLSFIPPNGVCQMNQ